jgi:methylmalonyl-CoA mutase C-terminal domain/subunit
VRAPEQGSRIRVLVGKPGLDGHDRGAKVVASALRDAGMEVIYTGLRSTPELIVATAVQESCDVIGLSVLSGAHETIARRTIELLRARNAHIPILIGGVIPPEDRERLKEIGIAAIYGQEATLQDIVAGVKALARAQEDKR